MLERNIKTNLSALQVFYSVEVKIAKGECEYDYVCGSVIGVKCTEVHRVIAIHLNDNSKILTIEIHPLLKRYVQTLTDDECEDVKRRMIKLCQNAQDKFEKWLTE